MNENSMIKNMIWRFAERCGVRGINFVVSIILARILSPDEYGTIALVTVFVSILEVFVDGGFPNALIQKKESSDVDFSTVFYFNLISCALMYLLLFFCAPLIANFYDNTELVTVIRILGLKIIVSGLLAVQTAYISRNMQFKKYLKSTILGTILSAVVGIIMVYSGCGVWSLVGQTLTSTIVNTTVLWFTSGFKPKLVFSFTILKSLFSYGWKLLAANLVETIYLNLRTLIIGKTYCTADLAYYNKGSNFPYTIIVNLDTSIASVLFPSMAKAQDDIVRLKAITRKSIRTTGYIVWPCMIGLFVCAEALVELLLTSAWSPCVPYLRLFCVSYAFLPMRTANQQAVKALGRSDIYLSLQTFAKVVGVIIIFFSMHFGVFAIAIGAVFVDIFEAIIIMPPNKKLLDYKYMEQIKDIYPNILLASFMGFCVWWLKYLSINLFLILSLQIIIGILVYISISIIFKIEAFNMILEVLTNIKNEKKR